MLGARSSLRAARGARAIGARQLEPPPISVPAMLLDADEQRVLSPGNDELRIIDVILLCEALLPQLLPQTRECHGLPVQVL